MRVRIKRNTSVIDIEDVQVTTIEECVKVYPTVNVSIAHDLGLSELALSILQRMTVVEQDAFNRACRTAIGRIPSTLAQVPYAEDQAAAEARSTGTSGEEAQEDSAILRTFRRIWETQI